MAYSLRVIVLLVLMFASSIASAAGNICPGNQGYFRSGTFYTTGQAACDARWQEAQGVPGGIQSNTQHVWVQQSDTTGFCKVFPPTNADNFSGFGVTKIDSTGNNCIDAPPPPPSCAQQHVVGPITWHDTTMARATAGAYCVDGCVFRPDPGFSCTSGAYGSWKVQCLTAGVTETGGTCQDPDPSEPFGAGASHPPDAAGNCAANETAGQVNGKNVCVVKDPGPNGGALPQCSGGQVPVVVNGTTTCGQPSDAGGSSSNTTTNADGSTDTTTTTTTCVDGVCTTVTTHGGKNADGSDKGDTTDTKSEDQGTFCKSNPTAPACKNGGSATNGDCPAPDTCTGDAIQCAVLSESHKARCDDQKRFDDLKGLAYTDLGSSVLNGNDPQKDGLPTKANGDQVDLPGTLDQGGWLGGGQCIGDRTFTGPLGITFVASFGWLCDALLPVRYGIMLVAGIVSVGIIGRATTA